MSDVGFPILFPPGALTRDRASVVNAYLNSLGGWTFDIRCNEASGNIINYGSDGGISNAPIDITYAQLGQLGPAQAINFNGTTSIITFANAVLPATKALTVQRWVYLVNASNLGEGSSGAFQTWGNAGSGGISIWFQPTNRLLASITTTGVTAQAVTNNNQVDFLNAWSLVFIDYDDTNALGLGRKIRLIRATAASPATLLTLATDIAATGVLTMPAIDFNIGNRTAIDVTFAGLMDLGRGGAGLWSPDADPTNLTRCEILRQKVFGA